MKLRQRFLTAAIITAISVGSLTSFAATKHWNDASLTPSSVTATQLAAQTDWQAWKDGWDALKTNYEQVSLSPGSDASKLNFAWCSKEEGAAVRISTDAAMKNAKEFSGTSLPGSEIAGSQYYANKVTADGFKPNKSYWYQVKIDGKWQAPQEYKTKSLKKFSFMFVGDPQIGASIGQVPSDGDQKQNGDIATRNDAYNWNKTLNAAQAQHPEINFIVSAGDQINEAVEDKSPEKRQLQEYQYAGYLSAAALRSLPVATTIGNHDSFTTGYQNHFNTPNPFQAEKSPTAAGHGYYYSYGDALFIVLNTNNYNVADHKALIEKAIAENPKAKWRMVMIHQDIYGSGLDHSDSDGVILRTQLTPIFDQNHIDAVFQGHDHTYARTYQLSSDARQHKAFTNNIDFKDAQVKADFLAESNCYTIADKGQGTVFNPKGIFYMTANSATGSKFYELLPMQQDYIAARNQTWRPTYSVVDVTEDSLTIKTYDVETGQAIDDAYTIVKK